MKHWIILAGLVASATAIWPLPSSYTHGDKTLWINQDVKITYYPKDKAVPTSYKLSSAMTNGTSRSQQIVQTATSRAYQNLFAFNFVPWKFHERNTDFEPPLDAENKIFIKSIKLVQNATDPETIFKPRAGEVDESYSLTVPEDGQITITAPSSLGLAHGLKTFTQLFFAHSKGGDYDVYTTLAPVQVEDAPNFQHRGINMDVARNYFPPKDIMRMIDAAAFNKFNRFRLHITDSQAWPLEIPALPLLAAKGAYGPGMTYTPQDLQEIQYYGSLLGVEVLLEIDMPGHTSSIWFSNPDLIAAYNIQPNWDTYAAEPPSGTLKLNEPKVYDFLNTVLGDLLPRISPYSAYFHTGGDEVNKNAYELDDTVKSSDPAVLQPLMQKFVDRNHKQVRDAGLIPMVWEEMLLTWNLTLGDDVVVQAWQTSDAVRQIVAKGHKVLVGDYNLWYLDCGNGQWLDFTPGAASQQYFPYADYCSPRHSWRAMYSLDPLSGIEEKDAHLVLGGECHIWAEQTDPVNIDKQIWPRAAAAGEVLWSGAKDASGQNRSQIEASPRLSEMRERLVARGVMAEPIQMPFCTMNGTQCALDH